MAKILTVFYSLKGETIAPGMKIVNLEKGHTAVAAEFIKKAVGGDIFELETVKTYMEDHMKMIYEAKEELEKGIYPELRNYPDIEGTILSFSAFQTGGIQSLHQYLIFLSITIGAVRRLFRLLQAAAAAWEEVLMT